jgi:hypothetical protein
MSFDTADLIHAGIPFGNKKRGKEEQDPEPYHPFKVRALKDRKDFILSCKKSLPRSESASFDRQVGLCMRIADSFYVNPEFERVLGGYWGFKCQQYATLFTAWRREPNMQHHYRPVSLYQPPAPSDPSAAVVISFPHPEELRQIGEEMDRLYHLEKDCRMGIAIVIEKDVLTSTDAPATLSRWGKLVSESDEGWVVPDDEDLMEIDTDAPHPSFPGELVLHGVSLDQVISNNEYAGLPKVRKGHQRQWVLIVLWHPSHPELRQDHNTVLNAWIRCMQEHKPVHIIRNQHPLIKGKFRDPYPNQWANALHMEHGKTVLPQHPGEGQRIFHRPQGASILRIPDEEYEDSMTSVGRCQSLGSHWVVVIKYVVVSSSHWT